jgi:sarcosine/dimethylglycine N-methyltransferase
MDPISFYDHHPINEEQILTILRRSGRLPGPLAPEHLFDLDQDHFGGLPAVETLARLARIGRGSHVLDVCAGLGGPARFLAWRFGCRVTGVDLSASRAAAAGRLSRLVGLAHRTRFVRGNATALPIRDRAVDACVSQEAWLHIEDKAQVLTECRRVLRPGGRLAFTDWIAHPRLADGERTRLREWMAATSVPTLDRYRALLSRSGFAAVEAEDLSVPLRRILRERLEMFRSLRATTVARFGQARYDEFDQLYTFFVGLVEAGKVGSGRFGATA